MSDQKLFNKGLKLKCWSTAFHELWHSMSTRLTSDVKQQWVMSVPGWVPEF